ncbi:MAG: SMP-30/gluconolactonase/LRE family protein [Planctomycetales bacterium]|nr:SMP-30/gluconolactonase/LRE family protein [Planctomycetales bacterium]
MTRNDPPDHESAPDAPKRRGIFRRTMLIVALLLVVLVVYLFLWPAPIDPAAYDPPPHLRLEGPLAVNTRLQDAEIVGVGMFPGPEDVAVDAEGRIYGGTVDGRIVRLGVDGTAETFATTGGRPLGLHFAADGALIVCDADRGLLSVDASGNVTLLTDASEGGRFGFTNDLDIASDGRIYFSDASTKFGKDEYMFDLLEARPYGRLLRYDPATQKTETLLSELYFANGVALSQDEDFVLVVETYRFRIRRYWLKGPRAGTADVFVDNTPGYPDGMAADRHGTFWVAIFTLRNPTADRLASSPFWKGVVAKLPEFVAPQPQPYGLVVALNERGEYIDSLHDPTGERLWEVTSVEPHDDTLYLGSLHNDRVGVYRLESGAAETAATITTP